MRAAAVLAVVVLAGCSAPGAEVEEVTVAGEEDGVVRGPNSLGVFVKSDDGTRVLADFDAEDWLINAIDRRIAETNVLLVVRGVALTWKQELAVRHVIVPDDLNAYRATTAESRAESREAWAARLAELDAAEAANP